MEAVVLFDNEKQKGDELNLMVGEVITNVTQVYHGWCEGTKNGERGMFPDNFVQMRPATEDVPSPADREQQSEKTTPLVTPTEPASGESTDTDSGEVPKGQRGRVLYRFEAEGSDEISLEPGQIVDVLWDGGDGWSQCRIGENDGYFPTSYVQLLDFTHPQATKTTPLVTPTEPASGESTEYESPHYYADLDMRPGAMYPISSTGMYLPELYKEVELPKPPSQANRVRKAKVLFKFEAEESDELSLEPGQVVEVLGEDMKVRGYWRGRINEREGIFPFNCVEVLLERPPRDSSPPSSRDWEGQRASSQTPYENFPPELGEWEMTSDEEAQVFLEEAMKQGYVEVTLVKVIVEGPAGVGKTSVIYLLLGKAPPEKRQSTGCAERAIRVIRVGKEGGKWSEISAKEFQEMIAEAVPVLYKELRATGKGMEALEEVLSSLELGEGEVAGGGEGNEAEGREDTGKEEEAGGGESVEGTGDVGEGKKEEMALKLEKKPTDDSKVVVDGVIKKLMQLVGSGKWSRRLLDMELIYLTDTGGQQPFWDLIPIFTYDTSATLFVNRLCEKLDDHPCNDLYEIGKQVGPSQRATLTTAEAFKTMLRGLHEGKEGKRSKIIAVGTHRDLADECEETLEEKNKKLAEIASPHFQKDVIFRKDDMKEIIFPVNTKKPEEDDKKEASKIRASIEKGAKKHKIPIRWFILQMILEALAHRLGRRVLSKDECLHISESLGFVEGELDAALAFFDKLNIFLYKKNILPNVVFTNPQVPVDKLSRLIEKQYHLKAAEADPTKATSVAMDGQWKNFRDSGVLTLECLNEFKAHYVDGIFTASDLLQLLKELLIISKLSPTEYFFPAVLSMTPESRVNQFLDRCRESEIAPLVVKFPTGWAPPGVYCCSVCHLQSKTGWEVVHKSPTPSGTEEASDTQLCQTSRNSITFAKHGRPGSVTFIDNFSFFVACVNVDTRKMERKEMVEHCQAVRSELFSAVEAGLENTHHEKSRPVPAFLCPHQNKSCSTRLHTAHLSENGRKWICSVNYDNFNYLTPDQTLWFSGTGGVTPSRTSAPIMRDLANRVAAVISHKWKQVAIQLDLSQSERKAIEKDEDECFDRFIAVLEQWKQTANLPYTWKTIVTVLKSTSVDEPRLAEELEKDFC